MDEHRSKKRRRHKVNNDREIESCATPVKETKKRRNKKIHTDTNKHDNLNPSISITKSDHDATLALLKSMDWSMAKNTSRRNVIREDDKSTPRNENGKPYCMSFIFGRNMKDPNGSLSFWSTKYPKVYSELQTLMKKYDPSFKYTHITLNYNLRCKRHTDGGNEGPSYIAAFGNFNGGELIVGSDQTNGGTYKSSSTDRYLDLKSRFVKFNGKTQPHETAPFTGDRYTLVYYTSDIVPPVLDKRAISKPKVAHEIDPESSVAKRFEAMKAKLGQRKKQK